MLYINQRDYPDKPYITFTDEPENEEGKHTTVKSSGCGLCSSMMMVDRLLPNVSFTLDEAIEMSYRAHANNGSGTKFKRFTPELEKRFPIRCKRSMDYDEMIDCLRTGGSVIALCTRPADDSYMTTFTTDGHYILVLSEEPDGRVCILDPDYHEGKFEEYGRAGRVEVKGIFCYCTREVLEADVAASEIHYYLFRRTDERSGYGREGYDRENPERTV